MRIITDEKFNIFKNCADDFFPRLRKDMIRNILYTDIKKHFTLLKDFENAMKLKPEQIQLIAQEQKSSNAIPLQQSQNEQQT
jgi:hypothetical protein